MLPNMDPKLKAAVDKASKGLADSKTHMGYLVDLTTIQFDEDSEAPQWIHMLPANEVVDHPRWGKLEFTPEKIQKFHQNAEAGVRGTMLDIDYEHKEGVDGGRAAGWIVKTEVRDNGLWALVDWTKKALSDIKAKAYRYFSPEFDWEWTDNKGNKYENVLFGGALTNRPFLKSLVPINLSERAEDFNLDSKGNLVLEENTDEEVNGLDLLKKIAVALGLKEDASEADVLAQAKTLNESASGKVKLREVLKLSESDDDEKVVSEVKKFVDFFEAKAPEEEKAKKFAELFPEEAKQLEEQRKQLLEDKADARLSEWQRGSITFTEEAEEDGKKVTLTKTVKHALAPKLAEPVKDFRMSLTGNQAEQFDKIMQGMLTTGVVNTGAPEGASGGGDAPAPASATLLTEAKKFMEEHNKGKPEAEHIGLKEAGKRVVRERPELAEKWQAQRTSGKTGTDDE